MGPDLSDHFELNGKEFELLWQLVCKFQFFSGWETKRAGPINFNSVIILQRAQRRRKNQSCQPMTLGLVCPSQSTVRILGPGQGRVWAADTSSSFVQVLLPKSQIRADFLLLVTKLWTGSFVLCTFPTSRIAQARLLTPLRFPPFWSTKQKIGRFLV